HARQPVSGAQRAGRDYYQLRPGRRHGTHVPQRTQAAGRWDPKLPLRHGEYDGVAAEPEVRHAVEAARLSKLALLPNLPASGTGGYRFDALHLEISAHCRPGLTIFADR